MSGPFEGHLEHRPADGRDAGAPDHEAAEGGSSARGSPPQLNHSTDSAYQSTLSGGVPDPVCACLDDHRPTDPLEYVHLTISQTLSSRHQTEL